MWKTSNELLNNSVILEDWIGRNLRRNHPDKALEHRLAPLASLSQLRRLWQIWFFLAWLEVLWTLVMASPLNW
jgi:hypothetical protein